MPYLRLYAGKNLKQQWELGEERLTIGRAEDNDVVLPDRGVSKHHAYIERQGGDYVIVDSESANGVYVNSERITSRVLHYWDEIQIFNHLFRYMASAKLQGEEDGPPSAVAQPRQESTMAVDIRTLGDLQALKQRQTRAFLAPADADDGKPRYMVDGEEPLTIGRGRECKLRLKRWFAPRQAAVVEKHQDGIFVVPGKRAKVWVNDRRITAPTRLNHKDLIDVGGLRLRYYCRAVFGNG